MIEFWVGGQEATLNFRDNVGVITMNIKVSWKSRALDPWGSGQWLIDNDVFKGKKWTANEDVA